MDGAVVKGEDGGVRETQQNGRMGDDEELGPGPGAVVDLPQQGQLPKLLCTVARKLSPWDFSWRRWGWPPLRLYSASAVATL